MSAQLAFMTIVLSFGILVIHIKLREIRDELRKLNGKVER